MYKQRNSGFNRRDGRYKGASRHYSSSSNNRRRKPAQNIDVRRFIKSAKPIQQTAYSPEFIFNNFDFHDLVKKNLASRGYDQPTQIQDQSIPMVLKGSDVIGIANTGTGKTAAFLLPILHKLINNPGQKVLIVVPTRELATQIEQECRHFAKGSGLFGVLLIGGLPIRQQLRDLKEQPEIIIGTPGRIKDHIERGTLSLSSVSTVVLDEVDRMLDMGFIGDIRIILSKLPAQRQSLFYSATLNPTIERLITEFTNSAQLVMAKTAETSDNVDQSIIQYQQHSEKIDKLHELLLADRVEKTLIFSETKRSAERLSRELGDRGFNADAIHGDKSQSQRQHALRKFREDQIDILVATDVVARGIDVDGITHVINYDLPQTYDDYTHRIGRAGRAGNIGYAVTFVTS